MIERDDAAKLLQTLAETSLLSEGLSDTLQNIADCIAAERDGLHLWGGDDEEIEALYMPICDGKTEDINKAHAMAAKYKYSPSPYELAREQEQEDEDRDGDEQD